MKQEINEYQFRQEFIIMNRDYYSYDGYKELYSYYEEFTLDVIAICCEVSEYTEEEFLKTYDYIMPFEEYKTTNYDEMTSEEFKEEFLELLISKVEEQTQIIKLENGSFLVWDF